MFPDVEVRHLQAVIVLADDLSVTRAAQRLHISQSALSKQITDLAAHLRFQLFVREKHRIVDLTDAGRIFVEEGRSALMHTERAVYLGRAAHEGCGNVLMVGHSHYADHAWISDLLAIHLPLFPKLEGETLADRLLPGCKDIPSYITKRGALTLAEAWQTCDDGHELVRLCGAMTDTVGWPTKQEILLVVCDCAETVFPYLPKEELRARKCVRVSRLWAEGKATVEEIREVGRIATHALGVWPSPPDDRLPSGIPSGAANVAYFVAYAASHAADADAHAAAGRAYAGSSSSFAFMCITNAVPSLTASVLADSAGAQGSPVWKDAQSESLKKMADLVRAKLQPTAWEI